MIRQLCVPQWRSLLVFVPSPPKRRPCHDVHLGVMNRIEDHAHAARARSLAPARDAGRSNAIGSARSTLLGPRRPAFDAVYTRRPQFVRVEIDALRGCTHGVYRPHAWRATAALDWVVVKRRPSGPGAAADASGLGDSALRDQCAAAGVNGLTPAEAKASGSRFLPRSAPKSSRLSGKCCGTAMRARTRRAVPITAMELIAIETRAMCSLHGRQSMHRAMPEADG